VPRATAAALAVVSVLYLALAATSLATLGPATATTEAPLAELLATGVGGPVRAITAALALLLTLGAMNAYFAGGSKLGAALARDAALPSFLDKGARAGEVPRRSLAVTATLAFVSLIVAATLHVSTRQIVLLATGSFVVIYVLGCAAAIRLLPRGSWPRRLAVVALVSCVGLLATVGWAVLWSLGVAVLALAYQLFPRRRAAESSARATAEHPGTVGADGGVALDPEPPRSLRFADHAHAGSRSD
jgi:amino acid efflux transporter